MFRKGVYYICILFVFFIVKTGFISCTKDYSYEGGSVINDTLPALPSDTTINLDSAIIVIPEKGFPFCEICRQTNNSQLSVWDFKYDTSQLCGTVTNAVITPGRSGFTFFGPSACSKDTGLVITVFLNADSLNSNKTNITSNNVGFEYYDNTTQSDIFVSGRPLFSLTIATYDHTTGIATGTFSGSARSKAGSLVKIADGNFAIKLTR